MSSRTIFLARLIGLYSLIVSLAMMLHGHDSILMVEAIVRSSPLLFIAGMLALIAGLAIVLGHNIWSGGALPVVVTLVGWISLVKGALVLFLMPAGTAPLLLVDLGYEQLFYPYTAISLVLGLYLTYSSLIKPIRRLP